MAEDTIENTEKKGVGVLGGAAAVIAGAATVKPAAHFAGKVIYHQKRLRKAVLEEPAPAGQTAEAAEKIELELRELTGQMSKFIRAERDGKWNNLDKIKNVWTEGGKTGKASLIVLPIVTTVALGAIVKKLRNRSHAEAVEADRANAAASTNIPRA